MIDQPYITKTTAQHTAVIHLTIPAADCQKLFGPAVGELMAALAAQGIAPIGPLFSHHLKNPTAIFDFEIGVPVAVPVAAAGRVAPGQLPAVTVARTVYHGPYEGLGNAWGELSNWIAANSHRPAINLWENYVSGPADSGDPVTWRTELNRPLVD